MKVVQPDSFEEGVMYAAALLVRVHDLPTIAANVLREAGLMDANVHKLDDYERESLRELNRENGVNLKFYPTKKGK